MKPAPGRYCACGCGASLAAHRVDAKWNTEGCAKAWERANPGRRRRDAQVIVVGPTKPRRRSGISVRIAARGAAAAFADELARLGHPDPDSRARELVRPLVAPKHRSLIDG